MTKLTTKLVVTETKLVEPTTKLVEPETKLVELETETNLMSLSHFKTRLRHYDFRCLRIAI
jgi:hypothetical protein